MFRFRLWFYLVLLIVALVVVLVFRVAAVLGAGPEEILKRSDVAASITMLKHDSFDSKFYLYETALEVFPHSTEFYSGAGLDVQLPPAQGDLLAVVHCHPDAAYPQPSDRDIQTAKNLHVPIFTVSRKAVWMTLPDGISQEVK